MKLTFQKTVDCLALLASSELEIELVNGPVKIGLDMYHNIEQELVSHYIFVPSQDSCLWPKFKRGSGREFETILSNLPETGTNSYYFFSSEKDGKKMRDMITIFPSGHKKDILFHKDMGRYNELLSRTQSADSLYEMTKEQFRMYYFLHRGARKKREAQTISQ